MFEPPANAKGSEKKIYIKWRVCDKLHSEKTEFSLLARYYYGEQTKENYMDEESRTHRADAKWIILFKQLDEMTWKT